MANLLDDFKVIHRIAKRAVDAFPELKFDFQSTTMDLEAAHCEFGLRLTSLLNADSFNFIHDVGGIRANLNRTTAKMANCFLPRFVDQKRPSYIPALPSFIV